MRVKEKACVPINWLFLFDMHMNIKKQIFPLSINLVIQVNVLLFYRVINKYIYRIHKRIFQGKTIAYTELFNRPIILLLSIVKNIQLVRRTQTTLKRKFTRSICQRNKK
jgi:hypothetical protein